jgi:hypothetical protein
MSTDEVSKATIILASPKDWDKWLEIRKTKATESDVWEDMDLNTTQDELPTNTDPTMPTAATVKPDATQYSQLSKDQMEILKLLRQDYKRELALYERRKKALAEMRTDIQRTVSRTYLIHTFDCKTLYEMLVALQKRVAPTDWARKTELRNKYQRLRKPPKSQDMEAWLQQWEKTFTDGVKLDIPETKGETLLHDFLYAISSIDTVFYKNWS